MKSGGKRCTSMIMVSIKIHGIKHIGRVEEIVKIGFGAICWIFDDTIHSFVKFCRSISRNRIKCTQVKERIMGLIIEIAGIIDVEI